MAKGDGTIIEKARGVFEVQVSLGRDPITGRYRRKSRTVRGTKADARQARDQIRRELEDGLRADGDKVTFSQFARDYTEARRAAGKAKEYHISREEKRLEFVAEVLGDPPLCKVDARTIDALYPEIRRRREAQGFGCGNTTLRAYHVMLKAFFKKAVEYDLIPRNPLDRVDAPRAEKPRRRSLDLAEGSRFLRCIDREEADALADLREKERRQDGRGNACWRGSLTCVRRVSCALCARIGLASGMRLGEVLRLTWGLVDFRAGRLVVAEAKTEAGKRAVAVDAETMGHLQRWKRLQRRLLGTVGIEQGEETPVLCGAVGGFLDQANFQRWWRRFREGAGFPDLKFHELRHTQATQLIAQGVDYKTVQNRLGHAKASITMDFYAHAVPENDRAAADLVGKMFREGPQPCRVIELKTA